MWRTFSYIRARLLRDAGWELLGISSFNGYYKLKRPPGHSREPLVNDPRILKTALSGGYKALHDHFSDAMSGREEGGATHDAGGDEATQPLREHGVQPRPASRPALPRFVGAGNENELAEFLSRSAQQLLAAAIAREVDALAQDNSGDETPSDVQEDRAVIDRKLRRL